MKRFFFCLFAITTLFIACQNNNVSETDADSVVLDSTIVSPSTQNCYQYIKNKDTANLMIINSGSVITGKLDISIWEKDKNKGMIKGEIKGDTLIADYSFSSEGTESIREVVLLKKGDQFLEGYGDVKTSGGKVAFKNRSSLVFGQGIVFTKIDCK